MTGDKLGLGVGLLDTGDKGGTFVVPVPVGGPVAGAVVATFTGLRVVVATEGVEVGA